MLPVSEEEELFSRLNGLRIEHCTYQKLLEQWK
jgi:hypothetical protein